jgi:hypothetical protein
MSDQGILEVTDEESLSNAMNTIGARMGAALPRPIGKKAKKMLFLFLFLFLSDSSRLRKAEKFGCSARLKNIIILDRWIKAGTVSFIRVPCDNKYSSGIGLDWIVHAD